MPHRTRFKTTAATWAAAAAGTAALLTGCTAHAHASLSSTPKMSAAAIADHAATQLAAQVHQPKPHIQCPSDLVGKVGNKLRCRLTAQDGTRLGVTITVTGVHGTHIKYIVKVDG